MRLERGERDQSVLVDDDGTVLAMFTDLLLAQYPEWTNYLGDWLMEFDD